MHTGTYMYIFATAMTASSYVARYVDATRMSKIDATFLNTLSHKSLGVTVITFCVICLHTVIRFTVIVRRTKETPTYCVLYGRLSPCTILCFSCHAHHLIIVNKKLSYRRETARHVLLGWHWTPRLMYRVAQKVSHRTLSISSLNIDQFSQFFTSRLCRLNFWRLEWLLLRKLQR